MDDYSATSAKSGNSNGIFMDAITTDSSVS